MRFNCDRSKKWKGLWGSEELALGKRDFPKRNSQYFGVSVLRRVRSPLRGQWIYRDGPCVSAAKLHARVKWLETGPSPTSHHREPCWLGT